MCLVKDDKKGAGQTASVRSTAFHNQVRKLEVEKLCSRCANIKIIENDRGNCAEEMNKEVIKFIIFR